MTLEIYKSQIEINDYLTLYRFPSTIIHMWRLYDSHTRMWVDIPDCNVDTLVCALSVNAKEAAVHE
jgi:hypothetical protein